MALLTAKDRRTAKGIAGLGYCNPFLPERVEMERTALGTDFVDHQPFVHLRPGVDREVLFPNSLPMRERAEVLADKMRTRLLTDATASQSDLALYEDIVLHLLYSRYRSDFVAIVRNSLRGVELGTQVDFWDPFLNDFQHFLNLRGRTLPSRHDPAFVFAILFQFHRAFIHIFDCIIGGSTSTAQLRADVWKSIFTHDMRRYARGVYREMGDISTLVTGPSGSGKELVARAIGLSRFVEFDAQRKRFVSDPADSYHALNLVALAPTLIESELFGHKKGAFSGAEADKEGWLEVCSPQGTVFLDEIGDLDPSIQVKLLRVLEERVFYRVGEVRLPRHFLGKFIAATNRDLTEEMRQGRFREDIYFRLCADMVTTPSLREQLAEAPDDLINLVRFVSRRILSDNVEEAEGLASDAVKWIQKNLGLDYAWPGNIRELEQCVRNLMIRNTYRPPGLVTREATNARQALAEAVVSGSLTSDQLLRHYYTLVYAQTGSYEAAATKLQVEWRTVRKKVDVDLLGKYRNR